MLYNKPEFLVFFIVVFCGVFVINRMQNTRIRNLFLLFSSLYFYSCIHVWFLVLLFYTIVVNYFCGIWISNEQAKGLSGKVALTFCVGFTIMQLVVYKYAYLIASSIILPIGLSFFTFQALTYTIDIYRKKIHCEKDFVNVALFISFFPTILSGPIERAKNLLPQLRKSTNINGTDLLDGCGIYIWGLFKKVVIADRLADYVDCVYSSPFSNNGSTLALAAIFYSFQIYCDFSGYSDMAVGIARMMGFNLMQNFRLPYFASTFKDFWRRWHISLTSWFTEYVYISLGGNRVPKLYWVMNVSLIFILSGVWHGATLSFLVWGGIHAILYLIEHQVSIKQSNFLYRIVVFVMITLAWVFFRIDNIEEAFQVIKCICCDLFSPISLGSSSFSTILTIVLLLLFIIRECLEYKGIAERKHVPEYILIFFVICLFGVSSDKFVYFQF